MKKMLAELKNNRIFVVNSNHKGGHTRLLQGRDFLFSDLSNNGLAPPCDALVRSLPLWWSSTGQAKPYFIFDKLKYHLSLFFKQILKKFCKMNSTEQLSISVNNSSACTPTRKRVRNNQYSELPNNLFKLTKAQLCAELIKAKLAKKEAERFIRNRKLWTKFKYPEKNRFLDCINKAFEEFLYEEARRYNASEGRLKRKIEAARLLFPEERELLTQNT